MTAQLPYYQSVQMIPQADHNRLQMTDQADHKSAQMTAQADHNSLQMTAQAHQFETLPESTDDCPRRPTWNTTTVYRWLPKLINLQHYQSLQMTTQANHTDTRLQVTDDCPSWPHSHINNSLHMIAKAYHITTLL